MFRQQRLALRTRQCVAELCRSSTRAKHTAHREDIRHRWPRSKVLLTASVIVGTGVVSYSISTIALPIVKEKVSFQLFEQIRADSGDEQSYVLFRGRPIQYGNSTIFSDGSDLDQSNKSQNRTVHADLSKDTPESKNAWDLLTSKLGSLKEGFTALPDRIAEIIMPDWVKVLPGFISKLQNELSMAPGSLAEEIWQEAHDVEFNPEICWDAEVRLSEDLCFDEKVFLKKRKEKVRTALAAYLDVPIDDIHPDDVPVIAMCGSGGGLRALVAGSSSYLSAKEAGLFDCLTFTAGVSGTCWLQALYYSSITDQSHTHLIRHLKQRLGVHLAYPPAALSLVNSAPTNKYLLRGLIEKLKGEPEADFGTVDIYGLLLAARLFVPRGELTVSDYDLKLSNQRRFLWAGDHPLPIYTAVRHEIPEEEKVDGVVVDKKKAQKEDWFQWFEFTPYEFWCEELMAGIPTWSLGRKFEHGQTTWRNNGLTVPEVRLPLLLGIWGSAFCATLSHYYQEIRPVVKGLAGFGGIDSMMLERDMDLVKVHIIDPATIPNYILGMKGRLPNTVPESLYKEERLKLMDAGMSNNLPIYPLLRPGRDVDIIIAFDVSADAKQANWLRVVEGYAKQRGIKGWPVGAGWPPEDVPKEQLQQDLDKAHQLSKTKINEQIKKPSDESLKGKDKIEQGKHDTRGSSDTKPSTSTSDLTYCNVWVGNTTERSVDTDASSPPSKLVEDDMRLTSSDAGICVIYFPLVANPKVPDADPQTSSYMSTWNFVYTPEQIDKVVDLARANFDEGAEQTRRAVRAVWERKKTWRIEKEKERKEEKKRTQLRSGRGIGKKSSEGDHGDHFS